MHGEAVEVSFKVLGEKDELGNQEPSWSDYEAVENVLVAPGYDIDSIGSVRPDGITVSLTLHFPKTFSKQMRGARVRLADTWAGVYEVVGDPAPYPPELVPGAWNYPVEVTRADG